MIIDCQTCPVRDTHCADCMVPALLAPRSADLPLDAVERAAVGRFLAAGLLTPEEAAGLRAHREPWSTHVRAVG